MYIILPLYCHRRRVRGEHGGIPQSIEFLYNFVNTVQVYNLYEYSYCSVNFI